MAGNKPNDANQLFMDDSDPIAQWFMLAVVLFTGLCMLAPPPS